MDKRRQVAKWVQRKIGKVLNEEIKLKIVDEKSAFNIDSYVNNLLDKYFKENDFKKLKEILNADSYYDLYYIESENSLEEQDSTQNSLDYESNECQTFSLEEIIINLENNSEEVKKKFLRVLEASAEDLFGQNFCSKILEILQRNLISTEEKEVLNLILKIFQKLLKFFEMPQIISKGFIFVAELLANQIFDFNLKIDYALKNVYDVKEEKWMFGRKSSGLERLHFETVGSSNFVNPEVLIKLMWLLLDCQQQIRIRGIRFNETRFREIIFSFVHLLSSTTVTSWNRKLSGLEIISVLDPKADWCRYWCHTAVGRYLLCSALRKYKNFFVQIIEIILRHMTIMKPNHLPSITKSVSMNQNSPKFESDVTEDIKPLTETLNFDAPIKRDKFSKKDAILKGKNDYICFNPTEQTENHYARNEGLNKIKQECLEWIVKGVPKKIVKEAVFLHSITLVSCLIQFRSGRALFPVQTTIRKRLLNVQDLLFSIIQHLENCEYYESSNMVGYASAYHVKVSEILEDLRKLNRHINFSKSVKKQQFSS